MQVRPIRLGVLHISMNDLEQGVLQVAEGLGGETMGKDSSTLPQQGPNEVAADESGGPGDKGRSCGVATVSHSRHSLHLRSTPWSADAGAADTTGGPPHSHE